MSQFTGELQLVPSGFTSGVSLLDPIVDTDSDGIADIAFGQ